MTKSFVIAIKDNSKSVTYAHRMIQSAAKHGFTCKIFDAVTPDNTDIYQMLKDEGISALGFEEIYSRTDNCISAFLSHYSLWKKCVEDKVPYQIFEHDAVVTDQLNTTIPVDKICTLGAPSYGLYETPTFFGTGPLTQKKYFGGAHAYKMTPEGAALAVERAKIDACPTDVFFHVKRFPWLQEHYPWRVKADDAFTTIQNVKGCLAKHNYGDGYDII